MDYVSAKKFHLIICGFSSPLLYTFANLYMLWHNYSTILILLCHLFILPHPWLYSGHSCWLILSRKGSEWLFTHIITYVLSTYMIPAWLNDLLLFGREVAFLLWFPFMLLNAPVRHIFIPEINSGFEPMEALWMFLRQHQLTTVTTAKITSHSSAYSKPSVIWKKISFRNFN